MRKVDTHVADLVASNAIAALPYTQRLARLRWVASRHAGRYEDALWETVAALGDRDTTCAIVGGIVSLGAEIPEAWLARREKLAS